MWCSVRSTQVSSRKCVDAVLVLAAGLALGRERRGAVEALAAVEELAVDRGRGGDAQGVALAASYGHALVERGALGGLQVGGAEEVSSVIREVGFAGQSS